MFPSSVSNFAASDLFTALGIDVRLLILQALAFLVLVFILAKFAYPTVLRSLEEHRTKVEEGLKNAKKAEADLKQAEQKSSEIIRAAREEAEAIIARGQKEAVEAIEAAEQKAAKRGEDIIKEAHAQVENEMRAVREALKKEVAALVAQATERLIKEKLDAQKDATLIADYLREEQ